VLGQPAHVLIVEPVVVPDVPPERPSAYAVRWSQILVQPTGLV
jgi:hypothetical protein